MRSRRTKVNLVYQGVDITTSLEPYLTDFTYTDNEGKSDDIQITLQDRDEKWQGPWLPKKGDLIVASVQQLDWTKEGDNRTLNCGTFYVDSADFKGPPDVFTIKALSVPIKLGGKSTDKSKVWEQTTLSEIAQDIADESELTLLFDATDYTYDRVDQIKKKNLAFLKSLAQKEGISVKVSGDQLILYDQFVYEGKSTVDKLVKKQSNIIDYSFSISDEYKKAEISYFDENSKKTLNYTFVAPEVEDGPTLTINESVESLAEAKRRAQKELRDKNKDAKTAKFTVLGNPKLLQGLTVDVVGFGGYDDKYFIESSVHKVTGGYTTQLNLRKVLSY